MERSTGLDDITSHLDLNTKSKHGMNKLEFNLQQCRDKPWRLNITLHEGENSCYNFPIQENTPRDIKSSTHDTITVSTIESLYSYACLKRWVLSLVLKASTVTDSRMCLGSLFQSFGALTLNAALVCRYLEEKFLSRSVGSSSFRRLRPVCFLGLISSCRYGGASPLMHL